MKKQLFTLIFLLSASMFSSAQITFQKTYSAPGFGSSSCLSLTATSDSGFSFAGHCGIGAYNDAAVTKTNQDGDIVWSETFGDIRSENFWSIQQIADGGYILAGVSRSFSVDSVNECYILRLSAAGNVVWEKIYSSPSATGETGAHSISQTSDGGFIIGGYDADINFGMVYMKTDSSGNFLWAKYVSGSLGTYGVQSIRQTADEGYIIAGNGGKLFKTDSTGNITWCKSYFGGAMSFSARETSDGGFMLAGEASFTGATGMDMVLAKTDSSGNILWSKTYGGALDDILRHAQQTSDGGFLLAGLTESFGAGSTDIYVVKTDSAGNLLWSKTYGGTGDELGFTAAEAPSGGFIIGGYTTSFGPPVYSAYLIKADANGVSGCNDSTAATVVTPQVLNAVTLNETAVIYIPDIFTPVSTIGASLVEGTLCSGVSTAVAEVKNVENNFSITPNPATGYVTVEFDKIIGKGEITFYDVLGARIFSEKINNEMKKVISLENIPGGIYFLKVYDGEKYGCRKVVVETY